MAFALAGAGPVVFVFDVAFDVAVDFDDAVAFDVAAAATVDRAGVDDAFFDDKVPAAGAFFVRSCSVLETVIVRDCSNTTLSDAVVRSRSSLVSDKISCSASPMVSRYFVM